MPISLTPVTVSTDLIDADRAAGNATLAALRTSDPDYLATLITAASDAIKAYCKRDLVSTDYTEYLSGGGMPAGSGDPQTVYLGQYPVARVARVAANPQPVLSVTNADESTNQRATVETITGGLRLTRVASAVTTTNTLLFGDYLTLADLAAGIVAAGGGWTASAAANYAKHPSADLKVLQGATTALAAAGGALLEMHVEDLPAFGWYGGWVQQSAYGYRLDEAKGIIYGYFPRGVRNVRVDYTAGYATVPENVQQACSLLVLKLSQLDKINRNVQSESVGPYSQTLASGAGQRLIAQDPALAGLLDYYVAWAKTYGE